MAVRAAGRSRRCSVAVRPAWAEKSPATTNKSSTGDLELTSSYNADWLLKRFRFPKRPVEKILLKPGFICVSEEYSLLVDAILH
jgi:hypothetical protein